MNECNSIACAADATRVRRANVRADGSEVRVRREGETAGERMPATVA
jgi:transcriptional regulator NrdR family protein